MSREMSETDHRVLAAPLDPERHACRNLHHDMAFSLKGLRPMSKAMLQLLDCHRRIARSGTGQVCQSIIKAPSSASLGSHTAPVGRHFALSRIACLRGTGRLSSFRAEHLVLTPGLDMRAPPLWRWGCPAAMRNNRRG